MPPRWLAQEIISKPPGCILHRGNREGFAIEEQHMSEFRVADAYSVLQHCIEHRVKLAGRGADNPENLRRRRLLLQRLVTLAAKARDLSFLTSNSRSL